MCNNTVNLQYSEIPQHMMMTENISVLNESLRHKNKCIFLFTITTKHRYETKECTEKYLYL